MNSKYRVHSIHAALAFVLASTLSACGLEGLGQPVFPTRVPTPRPTAFPVDAPDECDGGLEVENYRGDALLPGGDIEMQFILREDSNNSIHYLQIDPEERGSLTGTWTKLEEWRGEENIHAYPAEICFDNEGTAWYKVLDTSTDPESVTPSSWKR